MRKILCWFLGHDCMTTSARRRVCLRCGLRETLRDYGNVLGWEEVLLPAPGLGTERPR
jgi:hypothetical protein